MSSNHSSLSAAADERKARLAKLKSLKRKQPDDESAVQESPQNATLPPGSPDVAKAILSGRNYDPETKGPKLGFEAPPTLGVEKTLEQQAAEVEAEIKRKAKEDEEDDKGVDIFKLQPKKPNWDLKRDLDKKLEILNVRTENAIAALVRERIANAQKSAGGNVSNGTKEGITNGSKGAEEIGMDGAALVEGARLREHEDELEEQRDREDEDMA